MALCCALRSTNGTPNLPSLPTRLIGDRHPSAALRPREILDLIENELAKRRRTSRRGAMSGLLHERNLIGVFHAPYEHEGPTAAQLLVDGSRRPGEDAV